MTTRQQTREMQSHMRYLKRAMAAGIIPPKAALHRVRYCECGERVTGATHGTSRQEYGSTVLWQSLCACGSHLTTLMTDYRPEGE